MKDLSVLLVEDNEGDVFLTSELLYHVAMVEKKLNVVNDGAEALDYILKRNKYEQAERPDLIVLDINLPKISGREVLSFLKLSEVYQSIPVIIYTTSGAESDILYCYANKANLYLSKATDEMEFDKVTAALKTFFTTQFTD
jgi:two-component system, chemotaxis family, response regulator Rcp1